MNSEVKKKEKRKKSKQNNQRKFIYFMTELKLTHLIKDVIMYLMNFLITFHF